MPSRSPGGPLTEERIATLGIVKMNDYVKTGTRQQFWEEYYVRVVMQVHVGLDLHAIVPSSTNLSFILINCNRSYITTS